MSEHREGGWRAVEQRSSGNGRPVVRSGKRNGWTFEEGVGDVTEQVTVDAGTHTANIEVPDGED